MYILEQDNGVSEANTPTVHPTIQAIIEKLKSGDYTYKKEYQSNVAIVSVGPSVYTVEYVLSLGCVRLYAHPLPLHAGSIAGSVEIPLTKDEYTLLEVHASGDIQDFSPRKYLDVSPEFFNHKGYGG